MGNNLICNEPFSSDYMISTTSKNNLKAHAQLWERHPIIKVLLPYILGIIIAENVAFRTGNHSIWIAVLLTFISLFTHILCKRAPWCPLINSVCILLTFTYWGIYISAAHNIRQQVNYMANEKDTNAFIVGKISEPIKETENTYKINLTCLSFYTPKLQHSICGNAFVYVLKKGKTLQLQIGDTVLVPNHWQAIRNTGNPFSFDYAQYCARKNIYLQQIIHAEQLIPYHKKQRLDWLQQLQQYCMHNIEQHIRDAHTSALLKAMLLGDERELDPQLRQAYADTGIIHIISISGAHVAILFAVISLALSWIKQQRFAIIKYLLGLSFVWLYVILAGATTPALRAAILFSMISLGTILKQQRNPLNELLSAAMLMLLFEPMWLFQIGFQLSFLAVLSLLLFYQPIVACWQVKNRLGQWLWKSIATSIAAEILIAPLVAFYFHSFPPMFLIANLIAGLSMGIILILGLLLMVMGNIVFIGKPLGFLITYGVQAFHKTINLLQAVNTPSLQRIYISCTGLLLLYLFIVFMAQWLLQKHKKSLGFGLMTLCLLSLLALQRSWNIAQQEKLIVYNSGKSTQCEVLRGFYYAVITGNRQEDDATRKAHIGFGTHQRISQQQNNFILNKKSVCILDSTMTLPKSWVSDLLVISTMSKTSEAAILLQRFKTKKIVLGSGLSKFQIKQWQDACRVANIPVHSVKQDGAFVFE